MSDIPTTRSAAADAPDALDSDHAPDFASAAKTQQTSQAPQTPRVADLAARVRFDLTTVRLFIATAELGGITRAADSLYLVPAAASRRIRDFEAQLGLPLFDRLPHGMALTDAGRAMLAHARSMLHAVDRMQDDAAAFLHGDRGVVRIAACTSAVMQFLPDGISAFNQRQPGIRIDLQESNSQGVMKAVKRGVADLGVYEGTLGQINLPTAPFRDDRLCVVTRVGHPLEGRKHVGIAEILDFDVIGLTEGASISLTLARLAAEADRTLSMRIRVGSFDSMIAMIAAGIGIGVMPESIAATFATGPTFVHLPIDEGWARRRFVICRQVDEALSGAARAVFDFLAT